MFSKLFFTNSYFAGQYFPPVNSGEPPVIDETLPTLINTHVFGAMGRR